MANSAMATGSVPGAVGTTTTIAGYTVIGNSGLVGGTYSMNVSLVLSAGEGQGLGALSQAIVQQAQAAGASQISVVGVNVMNSGFNAATAAYYGWAFQQIYATTIQFTRPVP